MKTEFPDPNPKHPPEPSVPPVIEPPDEHVPKSPVLDPDPLENDEI